MCSCAHICPQTDSIAQHNLSSLNVDVLLQLMKFIDPEDRFNLVISGVLKGFENVIEGIDLRKRYSEHLTCDVSGNKIVTFPESKISKLNWGYVVMASASWKSGKSTTTMLFKTLK
jgi:hypothetical protein